MPLFRLCEKGAKRERGNLPRSGRTPTGHEKRPENSLVDHAIGDLFYHSEEANPKWSVPRREKEMTMAWTTPTLVEICIGLEINGYLPAEF